VRLFSGCFFAPALHANGKSAPAAPNKV